MKVTGFDRFLLGLFPKWGQNRLRAKMAADMVSRHYEAATGGRRTSGWNRNYGDADLVTRAAIVELRLHARDLIRNNAWAKRGQRVIANNTVGWGIRPSPRTTDANVSTKALALWKAWAESTECESEGRHTFYALQHLAMKSIASDGEILFRRRWRKAKDDLTLPMQVQVLEADFLDHSKNYFDSDAGGPIISGVEFDLIGRRAAYWIFPVHPGSGRNSQPSQRIPASEIIHVFYTERPGQSRGVSWFGAAIVPLKDFDEYEDATLMRQKIAACFAAFVTDVDGLASPIGTSGQPSGAVDAGMQTLSPGMVEYLPPGKNITFGNPPPVQEDGSTTRTLRRIATALGVTYEDLTGDLERVNFSSGRMGRLSHQANIHDWQENMLIPLLCQGVWAWAMEAAVLAGELPVACDADWTTPPMPMLEPDKEGLAYSRLMRNGIMTLGQVIREQGGDPAQHLTELAAYNAKLDELEIVLDSDPRTTTAAGQAQMDPAEQGAAEPQDDAPAPKAKAKRDDTVDAEWVEIEIGGDL